jgi:dTDP-4-dehydrorhamnose 3,5-epimerase
MRLELADIPAVKLIVPRKFSDTRGFFSETYNMRTMVTHGIDAAFVQDNHSLSTERGTIRGLHFQTAPHPQHKLIRVVRGRILDVALDLRRSSPTYGHHVAVELSAENWAQLFVPVGFAHGFCTLEADCEVVYKVSDFYDAASDGGILWNDPALGIAWPVSASEAALSAKDAALPGWQGFASPFA